MTDLETALLRIEDEIEKTQRPEGLRPTKAQMKRYQDRLDALTAERRAIRAAIAARDAGAECVFANDLANQEACSRFELAKQKQLDGLLRSCSRA